VDAGDGGHNNLFKQDLIVEQIRVPCSNCVLLHLRLTQCMQCALNTLQHGPAAWFKTPAGVQQQTGMIMTQRCCQKPSLTSHTKAHNIPRDKHINICTSNCECLTLGAGLHRVLCRIEAVRALVASLRGIAKPCRVFALVKAARPYGGLQVARAGLAGGVPQTKCNVSNTCMSQHASKVGMLI
jgi:hypothetical protein